ncbi:hypothetical protein VQ643_13060 [Pseudomonas sp. F1_0610]|uniref:hypothetical protein n=1 Tax=Pseudomonas sp. F1_0610 TaxID=3114284 RepID=UPI0039C228D8
MVFKKLFGWLTGSAGLVVLGALLLWFGFASPRLDLIAQQLDTAQVEVRKLEVEQDKALAELDFKREQLRETVAATEQFIKLQQQLDKQDRQQRQMIEQLRKQDETINNYLNQPVPDAIGRLYERKETRNPSDYRANTAPKN